MGVTREAVIEVLAGVALPGGGTLVSRDLLRALTVEAGAIRFVIEAATPEEARALAPAQAQAEAARHNRIFRAPINDHGGYRFDWVNASL